MSVLATTAAATMRTVEIKLVSPTPLLMASIELVASYTSSLSVRGQAWLDANDGYCVT